MVVFGHKWLYSDQSGNTPATWLYLGKSNCIRKKVVVFGQNWLYSENLVYSGKVVVAR